MEKLSVLFITLYTISTFRLYYWTKSAYTRKGGKWEGHKIRLVDYMVTFTPLLNMSFAFLTMFMHWSRHDVELEIVEIKELNENDIVNLLEAITPSIGNFDVF